MQTDVLMVNLSRIYIQILRNFLISLEIARIFVFQFDLHCKIFDTWV